MTQQNKQVLLANRPIGLPKLSDWNITQTDVETPGEGHFLAQVLYLSLDPAMRGWMNAGKSYIEPVGIDEVMRAGGVARVIESNHPDFKPGDHVVGMTGVQEYWISNGRDGTQKVDPNMAPLPMFLSVLGMPGLTAYFGILEVGAIKAGDTVVVSGGAGAVGSIVGQIAKIHDCTVVGIAGGEEKCHYLVNELGFDAAIDYKSDDLSKSLRRYCPKGVDVFFDNVGGQTLDCVLAQLRLHARVVICGAISQYNAESSIQGPGNYLSLLVNRARMEGFVVFDYASKYPQALAAMGKWLSEGQLKSREHIEKGIENFPETLLKLFDGRNFGKLVLQVGDFD